MPKILLTYCSFVIACVVVITAFITATTYTQLAVTVLLYPLLVFFACKVFSHKTSSNPSKKPVTEVQPSVKLAEKVDAAERENIGISDIDKRVFLKLIGGTGVFLFLFSLFNKKVGGLFPKGTATASETTAFLKDPSGNIIYPAEKKPIDDYNISDIENGVITFYGFISKAGSWYILRVDTTTGAFRYAKDNSNFSDNWSNRANLKYDYFNNIFKS